ncbi:MAG: hypothetical protein QX189_02555 [Methylococcales bacterium]
MNEVEQKIYDALSEIKRLMAALIDNVEDNEEIRYCITSLEMQLMKLVGRRVIKDTRKNG